jgi:signal transduction histidine kinase
VTEINNSRVSILIAEDSRTQAEQLKFILESSGYTVEVARNGKLALQAIRDNRPDLLISDIVMPEMDGYTLCSEIKREPDLKDIPVILLTSLTDPEEAIKGLQSKADNFITKPYNKDFLLERIRSLLVNTEMQIQNSKEEDIKVLFSGKEYRIDSDRRQVISLLLSIFENAIEKNRELEEAKNSLSRQAKELARSNADLEQFAYVASHDLQEPLRVVTGYTQLLEQSYKGKLDSQADEFIAEMVNGAKRMQRLIKDLLEYSRVKTKPRAFEAVNCDELLNVVKQNLKLAIEESKATLYVDKLPVVKGDTTQLTQLFQNLIGNAIKFRTNIRPEIHIGVKRQADEWIFSVKDNGVGLDPKDAERIFMIFQRLHSRDEYEGTGIGLAVCKSIVERHGGRIWVESKPGEGSNFLFTLPAEGYPGSADSSALPG